jgi:chemotaxis protein MotB
MEKKKLIFRFVKKKEKHGGHHGAWKVAYADFVTALMALFIVLWLTTQSSQVKTAVSGYFIDPVRYEKMVKRMKARAKSVLKEDEGGEEHSKGKDSQQDIVVAVSEFRNVMNNLRLDLTDEGIKIEMADTHQNVFFQSGSAEITRETEIRFRESLSKIGKIPYPMIVEGHTDATTINKKEYNNWELSMDRANSVRRVIEEMKIAQVIGVRAFGSTRLSRPASPFDPANRRVNLIVQVPKSHFY